MEEPQEPVLTSFNIYQKHLNFLEHINENKSLALRTVLDSIMRTEKKNEIKTAIDKSMLYICFGLLFFVFSFLLDGFIVVVPTLIGVAVLMYGLIGGVTTALSRTRTRIRQR